MHRFLLTYGLLLALTALPFSILGQATLTGAEYFWDTDPGEGNATAVLAEDGSFDGAIATALENAMPPPSSGGLHVFHVRFRDSQGEWGPLFKRTVANEDTPRELRITLAEYFWDTDPGEGLGQAMVAFDGDFDAALETALSSSATTPLQGGLHLFQIRVRDENGAWGAVFKRTVATEDSPRDIKIILGEYFWDTDPGEGSGTAMIAFDGAYDSAIETALSSSTTAPAQGGLHLFNVRLQDENGAWGPVFKRTVSTQDTPRDIVVTAAEYFWGFADPGEGNGTSLIAFDGAFNEAIEAAVSNGVNSPGVGLALYNIRVSDENGAWGPLFKRTVYVDIELVEGCLDPTACNYNVSANSEGACIYTEALCDTCSGEIDGTGVVVDNDIDNDGVCDADEIVGCQDSTACNYNIAATDAGTCIYPEDICDTCSGENDGTGVVIDNDADNDGVCDADEIVGCQDATACNYNIDATDAGACIYPEGICDTCSGEQDGTGLVVDNDADGDGVCDSDEIVGCRDATACNYNIDATDAGACIYPEDICDTCSGEQDGTGVVIDNDADDDGVCDADEIVGCQDLSACNYNIAATDAGTCIYPEGICDTCSGEQDGTGLVVDNDADGDGVCDADEIVGCQDATACNYNIDATDAGACIYPEDICDTCSGEQDGTGVVIDNDADDDGVCDSDEIVGCQDATACNYNIDATDAGACIYPEGICDTCSGEQDGTGVVIDNDADDDGVCDADEIIGCQDLSACNYNIAATDSGTCIYPEDICDTCSGEQDGTGVVIDNDADDDGVCNDDEIVGCQDATACNYNIDATDAGACIYPEDICDTCSGEQDGTGVVIDNDADDDGVCDADEIVGCQDATACNYNIDATDAGACIYPEGICDTCSGEQDGTGVVIDNDADDDGVCDADEIIGCQDATACNYNIAATDSGTCIYPEEICDTCSGEQDGTGVVIDNDADDDGVCDADEIIGCQDLSACNYNIAATDSGTCIYPEEICDTCSGEQDGTGVVIDNDADDDGVCDADEIVGCQDTTACNYNIDATDAGACIYPEGICDTCSGEQDGTGVVIDNDADNDGVCDANEIVGCQDATACNYNIAATDAGACIYPEDICDTCSGENDGTGVVIDNDIDNDGVCDADEIVGCQDATACNYDIAATDAGACIYSDGICDTCSGEQDGTGVVIDNDADDDGVCDADEIVGCQDATACNYNIDATDAGACIYPEEICDTCSGEQDGTGVVIDNDADDDGVCDADEIVGCQDATACNYNIAATDAGACIYPEGICDTCSGEQDGTGVVVDNDADDDGVCDADEIIGCQDLSACNYNIAATDQGACIYPEGICDTCSGEQDGTGVVVDNDADDDGVCDSDEIVGCQDATACNYNIAATDAGTCIYPEDICDTCSGEQDGTGVVIDNDADDDGVCDADEIVGCQDLLACNYNIAATDAGTCIYPEGICDTCSGEQDGTGVVIDNDADDDGVCDADEIIGCQDLSACNYNIAATDQGACIYPEGICDTCSGEQDGTGVVIDNDADNDGVCDADEIVGCQDATACNYNIVATDAGACIYPEDICDTCSGEQDGTGVVVDNDADDDGVCDSDEIVGCQDATACNYNIAATDAGTCIYPEDICDTCSGEQDGTGVVIDNDADDDGVCDADEIVGCQDLLACNYNISATDAGACIYPEGICDTCSGEQDGTGVVIDNDADDDGVCDADEIIGCQDLSACNYNIAATDQGACIYPEGVCDTCSGEQDGTGVVIDNDADNDGVCDADEIVGCQDATACNYNIDATDAGACIYPEGICDTCSGEQDGTGVVIDNDADDDGVCDDDEIEGCLDPAGCNYDPLATDEGECEYVEIYSISGNLSPVVLITEAYTYTITLGSTYTWTCTGGTIESGNGTNAVEVVWTEPGIGELCLTETNVDGCLGEEVCLEIEIISTGLHEHFKPSINIFPNPASTSITISIDPSLINAAYKMFDVQGRMVNEGVLKSVSTTLNTLPLASGNYVISIVNQAGVLREQIVIQK